MKKVLMGLAVLPLLTGVAAAGQPLTDRQMDGVTAGFSAYANAEAEGIAGESSLIFTATATLAQVSHFATASFPDGQITSRLWKAVSAAQSSSVAQTYNPAPIPGTGP